MLDRLRFQEITRAIFLTKEDCKVGDRLLKKGEPFLVIDDAELSNFAVNSRLRLSSGRSTEAATSTTESVSFLITNGQVMLGLFGSVFGRVKKESATTCTMIEEAELHEDDIIELNGLPLNGVELYTADYNGKLTAVSPDIYTVEGDVIKFIKPVSATVFLNYTIEVPLKHGIDIGQVGANMILSLEMQCVAMDIITEEKMDVLIKIDRASVSTDLDINFNDSSKSSASAISVIGLPEENATRGINKKIFSVEVI